MDQHRFETADPTRSAQRICWSQWTSPPPTWTTSRADTLAGKELVQTTRVFVPCISSEPHYPGVLPQEQTVSALMPHLGRDITPMTAPNKRDCTRLRTTSKEHTLSANQTSRKNKITTVISALQLWLGHMISRALFAAGGDSLHSLVRCFPIPLFLSLLLFVPPCMVFVHCNPVILGGKNVDVTHVIAMVDAMVHSSKSKPMMSARRCTRTEGQPLATESSRRALRL